MSEDREIPPGIKLTGQIAHDLCETFLQKYHRGPRTRSLPGTDIQGPRLTWLTMVDMTYFHWEEMQRAVFDQPAFQDEKVLYLMIWNWGDNIPKHTYQKFRISSKIKRRG